MHTRTHVLLGLAFAGFTTASQGGLLSDIINEAAYQAGATSNQRNLADKVIKAVSTPAEAPAQTGPAVTAPVPASTAPTSVPTGTPASTQADTPAEHHDFVGDSAGPTVGEPLPTARGALAPLRFDAQQSMLPAAQAKLMKGKIDALLENFRRTPALSNLQGYSIDQSLNLQPMVASSAAGARALLLARKVDPVKSRRDPASGALLGVGEGPGITVRINDQSAFFSDPVDKDSQGNYYYITIRPLRLQGFPVYQYGNADVVVIAKPGLSPFTMISKQRYLEGLIAKDKEHIGHLRKLLATTTDASRRAETGKNLAQWEGGLAEKTALLGSLSEAERRAPACPGHDDQRGLFASCDEPDAEYFVTHNPAYFDASKPKASIQLITIKVPSSKFARDETHLHRLTRRAVSQLDLKAMQDALD